ncbi:carbohydrate ABC transporter permease [Anaerotruncus colihominis]|uniref:ABC transporter, permease protein n=2 Tax=Anaerotruncus colihominis TaxID=169435 RepID=B0PHU3_9FIRM|nr:carbohydrate ABC transporter permease [Anaerotruncus colihominis]EDS09061.1 ABC transporter, permease protein [Anaerotruncus colihominis DSM 17241]OUO68947.1 sugar permease [Anaerotruncus colihominis]OUP67652.1 sugar permease [Anaerotruncus colihominis]OUP76288.1 sugar permease [Anaerotruncus colihominis]
MRRLKKGLLLLFLIILAVAVWFPLAFLLGGSFMGTQEVLQKLGPVLGDMKGFASWSLIPQYPTLRPYVELLLDSPQFFVMFWNSVRLTAGVLFGQMIVGVPAAWGFARYDFPGKGALFTLYIVLMLMPFQVTMVSNYLVLNRLSLLDTHMGIILPAVFSTFPVFIMYRFFRGIPRSLIESARLDGASEWQIFWRIGLPLGSAGVMSAMVLSFLECWSMIEQPMTFLKNRSLWPLSLYLPDIAADRAGLALAASVTALIPAILVFLYGQTYLEQGIIAAGVKE